MEEVKKKDGRKKRHAGKRGGERIKRRERGSRLQKRVHFTTNGAPSRRQNRQAILPYFLPFILSSFLPLFLSFFQQTRFTTYMSGAPRADLIFSKHRSSIII